MKIKALNDSKFVAAVIYVTSIVLLLMVVVTFALSRYRNVAEVVFSGALMLGTTAFLCLMFVPKVKKKINQTLLYNYYYTRAQ